MSKPAVAALAPQPFDFEIVYDDGMPLESHWQYLQLHLLFDLLRQTMAEQGRTDFYAGANQFVYYSVAQAREVSQLVKSGRQTKFRGPDVFWVGGVDPRRKRQAWLTWDEDGRLPDVIFEFLSPSTAEVDRTEKKELYARVFRTAEYYLYDPETNELSGFRLGSDGYVPRILDAQGRLWSERLGASVGIWHGDQADMEDADWVRLYRPDGSLVPTEVEAERRRANAERERADAAEAELARLRALLEQHGRS